MENRPRITRVVLENYKSIAFCDVKLGPLSILVGPNGAGKSNFLDALRFLSRATSGPTSRAFHERGGFSSVIRRGGNSDAHVGVRIEFLTARDVSGYYSARFSRRGREDYSVEREKCFLDILPPDNNYARLRDTIVSSGGLPGQNLVGVDQLHLPIAATGETFRPVFDLFQGWHFYNLSPKDFRQPIATESGAAGLAADGANLANVVDRMALRDPDVLLRIVEYLRAIYPALESVEAVQLPGYRTLKFVLQQGASFFPHEVSDGTLRSLAVLMALFQSLGGASNVNAVGLEEPEAALHPAAAGVLFDAMREASASVQVLATTHSADLLDNKDIDSDAILAVELEGGVTRIGHIDQTGRQALKRRMYTAGELMRMNYLRPEPQQLLNDSEIESILFGDLVPA
jgi:predicted ATPase